MASVWQRKNPHWRPTARLFITCCAPVIVGLWFATAQAQTTTLVSNTGKSGVAGEGSTSKRYYAQPFTTGSSPNGYNIDSVVLDLERLRLGNPNVAIWSSNEQGRPGQQLFRVRHRSSVGTPGSDGSGLYEWFDQDASRVDQGSKLDPDTTYHVVLGDTSKLYRRWYATTTSGVDSGSASGWKIDTRFWFQDNNSSSWEEAFSAFYFQFQIKGSEVPLAFVSVVANGGVTEGSPASFTLSRSTEGLSELSEELEVQVRVLATGDMVASGEVGTRSVTFAAGSDSATLEVSTLADFMDEPWGTVTVEVLDGDSYNPGVNSSATASIVDNDGTPTMEIAGDTAAENDAHLTFEVTLTNPSWQPVSVEYEVIPLTAAAGEDFEGSSSGTLTFASDVTSQEVQLNLVDDSIAEGSETVAVFLYDIQGEAIISSSWGVGTITDDEAPPMVSIGDATAAEDGRLAFEVAMDAAHSREITVDYAIAPSSAQTDDYTGATSGTLTFTADVGSREITLSLVDDALDEVDETVAVTLSNIQPPGAATFSDSTATGTITDNDVPVLSIADASAKEGANLNFEVAVSTAPAVRLTVAYSLTNVSTGNGDHGGAASGTAIFHAGSSATQSIIVPTVFDELDEPDETLTVELGSVTPGGAAALGRSTATGTIVDTNLPVVSVLPAAAIEGASLAFSVAISAAPETAVTVPYTVALGTAQAGDHSGPASGTVTFAAGSDAPQTITVGTIDDILDEADETVTVALGVATPSDQATVEASASTAAGTIADNDVPVLSIADATATEGSDLQFVVSIDIAPVEEVTVAYTLAPGTAQAEDHGHAGDSGTVTFAAGDGAPRTIAVPTVDDRRVEEDETLTVSLGAVSSGEATVSPSARSATGTIANDDQNQPADGLAVGGTARVDSVLTAITADVSDGDGLTTAIFRYQWQRSAADSSGFADIAGATSSTYRLTGEDFQRSVRVVARFVDDSGNAENLASPAVDVIADHVFALSSGEAVEGEEAVFGVTLQRAPEHSGETVQVDYELSAAGAPSANVRWAAVRNASCGVDAVQCGTLVFGPGEVAKEVRHEIPDNDIVDPSERRLVLTLAPSAANSNASVGIDTRPDPATGLPAGTVRIVDNEASRLSPDALAFLHAGVARATASSVVNRIWERAEALRSGGASYASVGSRTLEGEALAEGGVRAARAVAGLFGIEVVPQNSTPAEGGYAAASGDGLRSFRNWAGVPDSRDLATRSRFNLALGGANGEAGAISLWGAGDLTSFSSRIEQDGIDDIASEGATLSAYLGFDFQPRPDLLFGLAASRSRTKIDYGGGERSEGGLETEFVGAHPYLHLMLESGGRIWASIGYGSGQSTLEEGGRDAEADMSMRMVAMGIRSGSMRAGETDLAVKADVFSATISTDGSAESSTFRPVDADASRMRLAVEGSAAKALASGARLSGVYEIGARLDGGDAERGRGADVAARLRHIDPDSGLDLTLRSSALLFHEQDDFREWGIGISLDYQPDRRGRGMGISIRPSWGILMADAAESSWVDGPRALDRETSEQRAAIDARLGYGIGILQGRTLATLYGEAGVEENESRLRLGADVVQRDPGSGGFRANLYGERRADSDEAEKRLMLEVGVGF